MSKAETIRTGKLGKVELRLVRKDDRYFGMADGRVVIEGDRAVDVWRLLHDEAGKSNPKYFGFDGAMARFLKFFPDGFRSKHFDEMERNYKLAAQSKLETAASPDKAAHASGLGEDLVSVFRATNLLSPYEKTWVVETLRGPHSDDFIRAAARFTLGEGTPALLDMETALKPAGADKWTVATYLPYFWRPDAHMFLKPEATKDFATRVGHRFAGDYVPRLTMEVYESLLDLVSKTEVAIAALEPRDHIDIQSFIWVVGDYKEGPEVAS